MFEQCEEALIVFQLLAIFCPLSLISLIWSSWVDILAAGSCAWSRAIPLRARCLNCSLHQDSAPANATDQVQSDLALSVAGCEQLQLPILIASCSHQHAGILQPSFPDMAQQAINVSGLQVALSAHAMHLQPHSTEPEGLAEQEMSVGETPEIM